MTIKVETIAPEIERPSLLWNFLAGDRIWGRIRLAAIGGIAFVLLIMMTDIRKLVYLIAPGAGLLLAFFAGARYLQDIYEIDSFIRVARFLFASFFGFLYPRLRIHGGKKVIKDGEVTILDVIGGPGLVTVEPGNAVLFEGHNAPAEIFPNGHHFVPRFHTVQPIALEDQYGEMDSSAMSRDGLEVSLHHTRFSFRLAAGGQARTQNNPRPYSTEAIYNMVYNRTVTENGLGDWYSGVSTEIRKVLSNYVNRNTLDHLTAPAHQGEPEPAGFDPRGRLNAAFHTQDFVNKLLSRGAELGWIDIGSFEIPNKQVEQQRITAWQARWMGDARLARSFGEAQRVAFQEIGRAEAQAEMLISMMHALADVNMRGGPEQLRNLILVRTAQLLETMGEGSGAPEGGESKTTTSS